MFTVGCTVYGISYYSVVDRNIGTHFNCCQCMFSHNMVHVAVRYGSRHCFSKWGSRPPAGSPGGARGVAETVREKGGQCDKTNKISSY